MWLTHYCIKEFYKKDGKEIEIKDISKFLLEGFRIHPFMNGNSKTSRVLIIMRLLIKIRVWMILLIV